MANQFKMDTVQAIQALHRHGFFPVFTLLAAGIGKIPVEVRLVRRYGPPEAERRERPCAASIFPLGYRRHGVGIGDCRDNG